MELSPDLIAVLRCPESQQPLAPAPSALIEKLNATRPDDAQLEGGLLREDRTRLYPIVDGFPILLVDQAIPIPS